MWDWPKQWRWLRSQPAFRREPAWVLARLILWRLRCRTGRPVEVQLPESGIRLWLPPEWRGIAKLIYAFRDHYENELGFLRRYLTAGMVMVDAGACYGIYTAVAARRVGDRGKILAFEPAKAPFEVLKKNIDVNSLSNVRLFRSALGDRTGLAGLYHAPDPSRNSLGCATRSGGPSETVALGRLDDVLEKENPSRLDVIKIDVEGAEELVLQGGVTALQTWRPVVILEVNAVAACALGLEVTGACKLLRSWRYELFSADSAGHLEPLREIPRFRNVVALSSIDP